MLFIIFCLFTLIFSPPLLSEESYDDLERGLNLTSQQRIRIEQIRRNYMEEILATRDEILRRRLELINELKKENPDQERVAKIRREIEELETKRQSLFGRYRDEINGVLSPEQRRRFEDYCRDFESRTKKKPKDFPGKGGRRTGRPFD